MTLFEDAFSGFPAAGSEGGEGGTGGAGSAGGEGGSSGGSGANSAAATPNLPDWFARLDALVTRGAENIPGFDLPPSEPGGGSPSNLPQDSGPLPIIETLDWAPVEQGQTVTYIGATDAATGRVIRIVDGFAFSVGFESVEEASGSSHTANWTIADWDNWFSLYGQKVTLSADSLAALTNMVSEMASAYGVGEVANQYQFVAHSLRSQKERLQSLAGGGEFLPRMYDTVSYVELVSHARASLNSPSDPPNNTDIADAFIANYGYSGLLRLYRLEIEGSWNVAIRDLTIESEIHDGTRYRTLYMSQDEHVLAGPKLLYVNYREIGGHLLIMSSPFPVDSPSQIAARVHAAIYDSGITIHNSGVQLESTAAAALQSFLSDPKVRISLGILEVAGAWAAIPLTWGVAALPGVAAGWRGIDEIIGGLREIYNNEPNARSFTHKAVDLVTGDESLTNNIVLAGDLAIGGLSARQATKNAALKAEAKQAATAARAGAVTDDVAATATNSVKSASGGSLRATAPVGTPKSEIILNSSRREAFRSMFGKPSEGLGQLVRDLPKNHPVRLDFARMLRQVRASGGEVSLHGLTGGTYAQFIAGGRSAVFRYQPGKLRIADFLEEAVHWKQITEGQHLRFSVETLEIFAKQ